MGGRLGRRGEQGFVVAYYVQGGLVGEGGGGAAVWVEEGSGGGV